MSDGEPAERADGARQGEVTVREARQDDVEWLVPRVRDFYVHECGWHDQAAQSQAEGVPLILAANIPGRERAWIAEAGGGERAGCAFLTRNSDQEGRLRLLLVDPDARGVGIGTALLDECVRFARAAGYHKISVWTIEILHSARRLFTTAGFRMAHKEERLEPGQRFADETWELDLK